MSSEYRHRALSQDFINLIHKRSYLDIGLGMTVDPHLTVSVISPVLFHRKLHMSKICTYCHQNVSPKEENLSPEGKE